jgi:hypothetical protein
MTTDRSNRPLSSSSRGRALACAAGLMLNLLGPMQISSAATLPSVSPVGDATAPTVKNPPNCPDGRICWGNRCFCV